MSVAQYYGRPTPGISATYRMNYAVNSYFPSRKPRPSSLKGNKTFKKDIKETMQHAALINIVAAVNENLHGHTAPRHTSGTSVRSTITVIPSVIIPHEKTISIPQAKQRIFNMPDEIVQRKPVYYKHSPDLEVRTNPHLRFYDESDSFDLKLHKKGVSDKRESSSKEIIKRIPNKPRILNISFQDTMKNKKPENKHIQYPNEYKMRISSGVRRLGSVKKSKPREVYELPKCDAIDIQDTGVTTNGEAKSVVDDTKSVIPPYSQTRIPYIRTKSLPIMFPTKTKPSVSETVPLQKQPFIFKDRPLSHSLRKQTPDSMYTRINNLPGGFGYRGMTINNGINQAPEISGKLIHDSEKNTNTRALLSGNSRLRLTRTLRSPSSPTIGRRSENASMAIQNEFYSKQTKGTETRSFESKQELHRAVRSAMSGRIQRIKSGEVRESDRILTSARSRKSCLTSKSGLSETLSGNQAVKKVQFLSSDSSLDNSDSNSVKEDQSECFDVRGGSSVLQASTPTSILRAFSPAIQPMSAKELLRLERKILPANIQPPTDNLQDYYVTNSLLHVHTLQRSDSDSSEKIPVCSNKNAGNVSEDIIRDSKSKNNSETHDDNKDDDNDNYNSEDESEFRDSIDSNDKDREENDNENEGFYKLVRAFDKQPYEGFEHKKIRRASTSSKSKDQDTDNKKAQYVKVRLV